MKNDSNGKHSIIINKDDYVFLFQFPGMPYLYADLLFKTYEPLQGLFVSALGKWVNYIPKQVMNKTLDEGYSLISDNLQLSTYENDFKQYIERFNIFFSQILNTSQLNKNDVEEFFKYVVELHHFYVKTEYFYTDKAYSESLSLPRLAPNIKKIGDIKNSGREFINKVYLEDGCYIDKILTMLERQFSIESGATINFTHNEILDLFDSTKPTKEEIDTHKGSYVLVNDGKETKTYFADEAENIARSLFIADDHSVETLRGVIANKGIVKGRAKVMFIGFDTFKDASRFISEMNVGDVLVAETTSPELFIACKKASAIITNEGGLLSHAAIVSRELGIPCIVGLKNATEIFKDGDMLEVDANIGVVKKIRA